jgi:hypothetical protein
VKPDLLNECNDQKVPPREFKEMFCKRCRNQTCANAGWSSSPFDERVRTQVDRLLINPFQARPEDTRFDPIRAMHFVEVAAAIAIARRADPWAGPGVHLAELNPETVKSQVVEEAVSKLAEARGRGSPAPTAVTVEVEEPLVPTEPVTEKAPEPPVVTRPAPAVKPLPVVNPRAPEMINTSFPEEGMMIGGGPSSPKVPAEEDPWAPKPKLIVVPLGAKIRMGE